MAVEYWDLYDSKLINTGKKISGEDQVPEGYYHLALEIWIINKEKQVLLLKNTIDYSKRYPGSWCCIGGNLCSNESIDDAIKRIIREKIGITISLDNKGKAISEPIKRNPYRYAYITCIIFDDIDIKNVKFKDENSMNAKYIDKKELIKMCENGEVAYYLIDRINQRIIQYLK